TALFIFVLPSRAQAVEREVSGGKAFALSLLVPGLGHRYAHGGDWDGWASVFAVADAGLWAGLIGTNWREGDIIQSYETLAVTRAGADVDGKDRSFFLNMAGYLSSEEYLNAQLRNRNWLQIGFGEDPANFWEWESEEDFRHFRSLRSDAESMSRRRTFIITSLVANRLISGLTALRAARQAGRDSPELSLGVPPAGSSVPMVHLRMRL
ncbi:MAG: hypothetical protein WD275_05465, partial [Rhodothermales bacterium]